VSLTSTHWGIYRTRMHDGGLAGLDPFERDRSPSPIGQSMVASLDGPARVRRPAIRKGYLAKGPASRDGRGSEPFVEVPWDEALDIAAQALRGTIAAHGNAAIFGGSYGWASAGRFHHAQSQIHRFLNCIGGYVRHADSYSLGAARVLLPHILAPVETLNRDASAWEGLERHCKTFVAFGGLPLKNAQVNAGGVGDHEVGDRIRRLSAAGTTLINVSPARADLADGSAEWLSIRPNTDACVMLALAYEIVVRDLHDKAFLEAHCVGAGRVLDHLLGRDDGQPKTAEWASAIAGVSVGRIRALAVQMATTRTMIALSWSLQRARHGEQPYWAAVTLAAILGQIGLPGGGIGFGYAAINGVGARTTGFSGPRLPQGDNPVKAFIPVARIADMLLGPGTQFDYNGQRHVYPDIRLVYWAGGNVFHHHQDINRLIAAWRRPETIIVHEQFWTAQAKFSDLVLPATTSLERDDIGAAGDDAFLVAMKAAVSPVGEARDDYAIFAELARRLDIHAAFTSGRSTQDWLRALYDESCAAARAKGVELPEFDRFWDDDYFELPPGDAERTLFSAFRADPSAAPLATPSGRIELHSDTIAGFGYEDCPGHAVWRPAEEWLGASLAARFPLHLLSNQPTTRLHSQYDHGSFSRASKIKGREPIAIATVDAAVRGIRSDDIVRVFNDRGAFLAAARVTDGLMPGVVQIATGAWYDPETPGKIGALDLHGNPNMVTADRPSSMLSQGCAAQSALVQIERYDGSLAPVAAFDPPKFDARD
jgi:biotin/methionine sulfoxide reductase